MKRSAHLPLAAVLAIFVTTAQANVGRLDPCVAPGPLSTVGNFRSANSAPQLDNLQFDILYCERAQTRHILAKVFTMFLRQTSRHRYLLSCLQGKGFYVGVAFWPGGTIEDWGPVYQSATNYTGPNPCLSGTEYNATGLTHQQYLVRSCAVPSLATCCEHIVTNQMTKNVCTHALLSSHTVISSDCRA